MASTPNEDIETRDQGIKLMDVLMQGLRKWPWILLSVFVCVGLAFVYIKTSTPTYKRLATVRIKEEKKGGSISSELSSLGMSGVLQGSDEVLDEISTFESNDFAKEVVRRLKLDVNYTKKGRFHNEALYGKSLPITVSFLNLGEDDCASLKVEVSKNQQVQLSDFKKVLPDGKLQKFGDKKVIAKFGVVTQTPIGQVIVTPTENFKPGDECEIEVGKSTVKGAAGAYSGRLTVAANDKKRGSVINLTMVDQNVERADDYLRTLLDVYNESGVQEKNNIASSTTNFINERLNVIEAELGNVDRDISTFKSENMVPDVEKSTALYMEQNRATTDELVKLESQYQMLKYIKDYMGREENRREALPSNMSLNNLTLESQITDYNAKLLEYRGLLDNSSKSNPVVAEMDKQLTSLRRAISNSIDNNIVRLNMEIKNLERSENLNNSKIAASPSQARYLLSVERQQKVKEELYLYLLQKREENELSQAYTVYNTRVINSPDGPNNPESPKKMKILAAAFLLGLLLPFIVIYVIDITDRKLRNKKQMEGLRIPFMGEIPFDKAISKANKNELVVSPGNRDMINESFRVLRTNIGFICSQQPGTNAIMVTSFNPGSGKSFVTMNVAEALSIRGKRVVVIDGDMRHGSTSMYVGNPHKGLSNYLIGEVESIDDVMVSTGENGNLKVIPIGKVPPNPTELLESTRFKEMINLLKEKFDYVFVDCPPINLMADSQIVNGVTDRTLFIVRAGLLDKSMLPELDKMYKDREHACRSDYRF